MSQDLMLFPEAGAPQGGPVSPLLCNVALHGLEEALAKVSRGYRVVVIRYADDLVILCEDLGTLLKAKEMAEAWLAEIGLRLKPSKTRITHTLDEHEGNVGFDFLGFNIRQYRVGKYRTRTYRGKLGFKTIVKPSKDDVKRHLHKIREVIHQYRGAPQMVDPGAVQGRRRALARARQHGTFSASGAGHCAPRCMAARIPAAAPSSWNPQPW